MVCNSCGLEKQAQFSAEINIHFPGEKGLDEPGIWVFPKLEVCLVCGWTQFRIPEGELNRLETSIAA